MPPKKDPQVDAYIAKAPAYAKPILTRLRKVVHTAIPGIVEGTKWSSPHFDYKGIFCSMSAFKQHAMFGFWLERALRESLSAADGKALAALHHIESIDDLPDDKKLIRLIKAGAKLNDAGVKMVRAKKPAKPMPKTPPLLIAALDKNTSARATFDNASPSFKREYVNWIADAKSDDTRQRRVETAVAWMAEGKGRNWKYESKK
ncbi:MAG TPA: YdeI/OmpD-associated family protein [Vicinamibacterales bacterium]|nr:YdeI/OmpD-associated family protein [Vicinamibacterales bacterium]